LKKENGGEGERKWVEKRKKINKLEKHQVRSFAL